MAVPAALVRPDDYGIESKHYYYLNRDRFNLSLNELAAVGVGDDKCRVSESIIPSLLQAKSQFNELGYTLVIKDGYRSPALYELVARKRSMATSGGDHFGTENTKKLLNTERMIHASGNVVDIDLIPATGTPLRLRSAADGVDAHFYGYYLAKTDPDSITYQKNQDLMKNVMFGLGFVFGSLIEYWHFELPQPEASIH